jgi:hypothetical protein
MVKDFALKQTMITLTKNLPNKKEDGELEIKANAETPVKVAFESGWHINELAPTYLALFDVTGNKLKFLKSFDHQEVSANHIVLPALKPGGKYRLQGTFYYCEVKAGSACLIQSHDFTLLPKSGVGKDGSEPKGEVEIKLAEEVKK